MEHCLLQLQIDECVKIADKATSAQATAGTDDTKWMTPAKTKAMINANPFSNVSGTQKVLSTNGLCALTYGADFYQFLSINAYTTHYAIGLTVGNPKNSSSTQALYLTVCNKSSTHVRVYQLKTASTTNYYFNEAIYPIPNSDQVLIAAAGTLKLYTFSGDTNYSVTRTYTNVSIPTSSSLPTYIQATDTYWALQSYGSKNLYYGKLSNVTGNSATAPEYSNGGGMGILDTNFVVWILLRGSTAGVSWTISAFNMDTKESSKNSGTISSVTRPTNINASSAIYDPINNIAFAALSESNPPLFTITNRASISYAGITLGGALESTNLRFNIYAKRFTDSNKQFIYEYTGSGQVKVYGIASLFNSDAEVAGITKNFLIVNCYDSAYMPSVLTTPNGSLICAIEKISLSGIGMIGTNSPDRMPATWDISGVAYPGNDDIVIVPVSHYNAQRIAGVVKFVCSSTYKSNVIA